MSFPVTVAATLTAPPDSGLTPDDIPFSNTITVTQKSVKDLSLTGASSHTVDFGTIGGTGAKILVVKVGTGTGYEPITLRWNSGTASGEQEVSPGGMYILTSPTPVTGLTELEITHTSDVTVKLWLYG